MSFCHQLLTTMLKTLDVVAAIIEKDDNILLAQRPAHADQPGMWEFAGGKVEAGETQPEALVRELREELGIDALPGQYVASHQREVSQRVINLHARTFLLSRRAHGALPQRARVVYAGRGV